MARQNYEPAGAQRSCSMDIALCNICLYITYMMKQIEDSAALAAFPEGRGIELLFLSRPDCGVCAPVKTKVEQLTEEYPEVRSRAADLSQLPEAAGILGVFTVPAVLLYVKGKETLRFARHFSMDELAAAIERYRALLYQ